MAEHQEPFADVVVTAEGFSLPELKWRELLFVGALKPVGSFYTRDPARPLPPFRIPGLFPEGVRFEVAARGEGRVVLRPAGGAEGGCV
ncbi:MAG TPA: hypothetical protein VF310_09260 [Vicinamibacteria bacterium]|jgi:hypothetical protein